jgi:hypothetical protein
MQMMLMAGAYHAHPEIAQAWDARYRDQNGWALRKASLVKSLYHDLQRLPDATATADVAAVNHAVRGASTTEPAPAKPFDRLHDLPDADYARAIEKAFGYVPKLV